MSIRSCLSSVLFLLLLASTRVATTADEGMWTFDNPPIKQLKEKYNFTPTQQWLDHIRLSSVQFNDGGSGSFLSPNVHVITKHLVDMDDLKKKVTQHKDNVKEGIDA